MLHQALTASENEAGPVDRFLAGTERSLARRLALTPEERAAVHEELARTSHEFKRDRAVFFNSVRGIAVDTIARMARRLPPEKSAQLQKLAHQRFVSLGLLPGPSPASSPR